MRVESWPEPRAGEGAVLIETHWVGVCGTDRELAGGRYGAAPPGDERLVIGHEAVGTVLEAPEGSGLARGDWAVPIVRRPDTAPCSECASGEWQRCSDGRFTESGISGRHGFARERFRAPAAFVVKVPPALGVLGVLVEPTSTVENAWERTDVLTRELLRAPERVLVLGAGPIGLLAALLGIQRSLEVHVLDRVSAGPKPRLASALGAVYHDAPGPWLRRPWDLVFECTGAPELAADAIRWAGPNGVVCLVGIPSGPGAPRAIGSVQREWVLENNAVLGTVSANRRHYQRAIGELAQADRGWLAELVTSAVPVEQWRRAVEAPASQIKSVLSFAG